MQKILKIIAPILVVITLIACDTLVESDHYPLNPLSTKQKDELDVLLDHKSKKGKGIYKVQFDTVNDHTVLKFMYSRKQTDLSDLTGYLFDNDLINKNYISQVTLDSMLLAKEKLDSIKLAEEQEDEEGNDNEEDEGVNETDPVLISDLIPTDSLEDIEEEDSVIAPSVGLPLFDNPDVIENPDTI